MYKLEFTLKQHTPIIHFQYFLSDATLRSTELKSALDKFIIGNKFNCWSSDKKERLKNVLVNEKYKKWLKHSKEPSNPSLDYDVELFVLESSLKTIVTVSDLKKYGFFGNQPNEESFNDKEKYKKGLIQNGLIKLVIKSPYDELLKEIDEIIAKFFLIKNFGTRQSKGFGCFYPIEKYSFLKSQKILPYYFDLNEQALNTESNPYKNLFQIITLLYNTLRSGLNVKSGRPPHLEDKFYFKSLMWAYAKENKEHWDKKSIKTEYANKLNIKNREWIIIKNYNDATIKTLRLYANNLDYPLGFDDLKGNDTQRYLWRDLLGLSSTENANYWKLSKEHREMDKTKKLTRFKSPIIFKPFMVGEGKYRVFFGVAPELIAQFNAGTKSNTEAEILGKTFAVKFNNFGNLKLKYPDTFDYQEYLKFAINTYNSSHNWVESKFHYTNEYQIIDSIYKQLKAQVK